jgi:hypothetical protein
MEASYTIVTGRGSRVGINDLSGEAQASITLYTPYTQTTSVMEACYTILMGKGCRVGMDDLKAIHMHGSSVLMVVLHWRGRMGGSYGYFWVKLGAYSDQLSR